MKTGYSFGSLVNLVENLDRTTVKLSGDQTIEGLKGFNQNPYTNAAQGQGGGYLTRKDYVDNALGYKANTDSPAFTGNPTAPTAALFDGDTTIATTAFVQRALGNHQKYVRTDDATVQPTWVGCFIWYAGAGTLYLLNYANVPVGATLEIMCTGGGAITAQSGEMITLPNGVQINSITPLAGDTVKFVRLDTCWAYSGTSYTPTAAASDNSTRPASTAHVKNYLLSSPQLAGNVYVEGTVNATGEYQTTNTTGYRIAYGDYGSFWYFDEWNTYLMFTNSGDKWGGFNSLRPFSASCRTGRVTMSNGVSVAGGLVVDDGLTVTGGANFNQYLKAKQFIYVDGPYAIANWDMSVANNYSFGGLYDSSFGAVGGGDYFLPILSGSVVTSGEGYTTRVKFGIHTDASQGGWLRKNAGIWVGSGESAAHPRYLYKFNVYGGFTAGAVNADSNITAGTNINAGGTVSAPFLVSTAVDQGGLRFTGGRYGVMCNNDSSENFYFLLTNIDDQLGDFNSLRPFVINKRTGLVAHKNGLTVDAGLWTDQVHISSTTNSAPTQEAGTNNTTIATTAFVNRKAGGYSSYKQVNSSVIMDASYIGSLVAPTSTSAITWTLPEGVSGDTVEIYDPTGLLHDVTIVPPTGYIYREGTQNTSLLYRQGRWRFVYSSQWILEEIELDALIYSNVSGTSSLSVTLPYGTKRITITLYHGVTKLYTTTTIPINTLAMYGNGTHKICVNGNMSTNVDGVQPHNITYTYNQSTRLFTVSDTSLSNITYVNAEA